MELEQAILQALHENPADEASWRALTDWLEEQGSPQRAELLRLHRGLRERLAGAPTRRPAEQRIMELLAQGVRPCVPTLTNSIGMQFALIPAGMFWMGEPGPDADVEEQPLHRVEITRPFYMGVHLVTQGQYERVMGNNQSRFREVHNCDTSRLPIEGLTWYTACQFSEVLSALPEEKAARRVYRLPTEAEWEYACRAWFSPSWPFHFGDALLPAQANIRAAEAGGTGAERVEGLFLARTSEVGSYPPNAFGLYDLHGNLAEWCSDWFRRRYYKRSPRKDPRGPKQGGRYRVLRGGAWGDQAWACRTSRRIQFTPGTQHDALGARLVLQWRP